eukprot:4223590-Prorocentrum_lima.AAC.1
MELGAAVARDALFLDGLCLGPLHFSDRSSRNTNLVFAMLPRLRVAEAVLRRVPVLAHTVG